MRRKRAVRTDLWCAELPGSPFVHFADEDRALSALQAVAMFFVSRSIPCANSTQFPNKEQLQRQNPFATRRRPRHPIDNKRTAFLCIGHLRAPSQYEHQEANDGASGGDVDHDLLITGVVSSDISSLSQPCRLEKSRYYSLGDCLPVLGRSTYAFAGKGFRQ